MVLKVRIAGAIEAKRDRGGGLNHEVGSKREPRLKGDQMAWAPSGRSWVAELICSCKHDCRDAHPATAPQRIRAECTASMRHCLVGCLGPFQLPWMVLCRSFVVKSAGLQSLVAKVRFRTIFPAWPTLRTGRTRLLAAPSRCIGSWGQGYWSPHMNGSLPRTQHSRHSM